MTVNFFEDCVPQALIVRNRWLGWRFESRNSKFTKAPINPHTGNWASVCDSFTWGSFDEAKRARKRFSCDGLGFVLSGDGVVAVDLDGCVRWDGDNYVIEPSAKAVITALNSYTEFSPSLHGIHIFAFGSLPEASRRSDTARLEIYSSKQYLTVTGHLVPGCPDQIETRPQELLALYRKFFPTSPENLGLSSSVDARSNRHSRLGHRSSWSDDELLNHARAARNGAKFCALFDAGDTSQHQGDDSRADLALCGILAYWTDGDAARIDTLFRQSALYRPKWERRAYRERTIAKALDRCGF